MDEKNLRILEILCEDCKKTTKQLARLVGLPQSTVYARIKAMESKGIIKKYKTIIDEKKLGYNVKAFIFISYVPTEISQEEVAKRIARFPQVKSIYIIAGEWDVIVEVIERDVDMLGEFVVKKLREIKGVNKTLTCVVLKRIKEDSSLPVKLVKV